MAGSCLVSVTRVTRLTEEITRVRLDLGSKDALGMKGGHQGDYIKLHLVNEAGEIAKRTYTIRHHYLATAEIDVDFVVHGTDGLASAWALSAAPGDRIEISGPGKGRMPTSGADWYFLAGDMTALPAMSVIAESLPADSRGYMVVEVANRTSAIAPNTLPRGMELYWVNQDDDLDLDSTFLERVRSLPWLSGEVAIWAASEFDTMRAMRAYFKKERGVPTSHAYISSYWKRGLREDEHKKVKKKDADAAT